MKVGGGRIHPRIKAGKLLRDLLYLSIIISALFWWSGISFAQEFTARTLGDYGNVTVMEATGNYNATDPDGSPRRDEKGTGYFIK